MNNPFEDIEKAFVPMFLDIVEVSGNRKNNQAFKTSCSACTFPVETVEPFTDSLEESNLLQISVYIMKKQTDIDGWSMDFKPQIGDFMKLLDDSQWKITSVKEANKWYEITGRNA